MFVRRQQSGGSQGRGVADLSRTLCANGCSSSLLPSSFFLSAPLIDNCFSFFDPTAPSKGAGHAKYLHAWTSLGADENQALVKSEWGSCFCDQLYCDFRDGQATSTPGESLPAPECIFAYLCGRCAFFFLTLDVRDGLQKLKILAALGGQTGNLAGTGKNTTTKEGDGKARSGEIRQSELGVVASLLSKEATSAAPPQVLKLDELDAKRLTFFRSTDLKALQTNGFVVVNRPLLGGAGQVAATSKAIASLEASGALSPAKMQQATTTNKWSMKSLRGDLSCWVRNGSDQVPSAIREATCRLDALRDELNAALPSFQSDKTSCQVAAYPGNMARYVRHLDAGPKSKAPSRRLTMLIYPNPGWKEGDGGELRIHTRAETGPAHVDVTPTPGKVVVFLSAYIEHEVLPAKRRRSAITMWLY